MGARHGQQGKRTRASLTLAAVTSALVVLPLLLSPSYAAAAGPNDTLSIDRVTPDWSLIEGDQEVVIEGSGFTRGSSVWFGSSRATEVTFVDSSHLKAVTPAKSAGRYTLQINTQEGLVRTLPSAVSFVKLPTMSAPAVSNVTADSFDLTLPSKPAGWVKDNAWTIDFVDTVTGESLGGTSCNQDLNSANLWPAGTQTCTMQYSRLVLPDHDYHVVFRVYDWAGHSKNSAPTNVHLPAAPSMPAVTETLLIDEIGVNGFTLMTPDMGSFATRTAMPDNRYQPAVQLLDATGQPIGWFDNSGDFRPLYPCPEEGCLDSTSPQHSIEAKSNTKIGVISADHIKAGTTYKARIQLYDSKYSRSTYGPTTTITTVTQAPDSPESVSAEIPDLTSANLSWLRPTDTGGAPIQKYEVSVTQTAPSAAAYTLRQQLSSTPQAVTSGTMKYTISPGTGRKVSKSFTSLDSNSAYVFTVVAINKSGRSAAAGIVVDLSTRVMTLKTAIPNISGSTRVGSVLSANPGSWTPGTTFSYQWKRGNTSIGTNSATYKLTRADLGKNITVIVTGKKSRYRAQSVTSQPTAVVR